MSKCKKKEYGTALKPDEKQNSVSPKAVRAEKPKKSSLATIRMHSIKGCLGQHHSPWFHRGAQETSSTVLTGLLTAKGQQYQSSYSIWPQSLLIRCQTINPNKSPLPMTTNPLKENSGGLFMYHDKLDSSVCMSSR